MIKILSFNLETIIMKLKFTLVVLIVLVSAFSMNATAQRYNPYNPEVEYYRAFNRNTRGLRLGMEILRWGANVGTRENARIGRTYRFFDRQIQNRVRLPRRYQYR